MKTALIRVAFQFNQGDTALMQIVEATIHHLIKDAQTSGPGSTRVNPRPSPLATDEVLLNLCTELLSLYTRSANSYGTLGNDATLYTFPVRLNQYVDEHLEFQTFTTDTVGLIAKQMDSAYLANGGYALFLRYTQAGEDFLLVAMLKLKAGAGIDEATLSLQPTLVIDLSLLHEAARINISKWRSAAEPYLSFIKGKTSGDVTAYFRDALACQNFTNSSHHTATIIRAADDFVAARDDLDIQQKIAERTAMRTRLYECFSNNPNEVVLPTLAAAIMPGDPQQFVDFLRTGPLASGYQVNDTFKPHRQEFNKLRRITGRIGSISVGFDVSDVQEGRVYYDADADGIVLKNPPEMIKQAIAENAADN